MWIARISRGLSSRDVQSSLPLARSVSCPIERVVPSFYSGVDEGEMMIMGQGGSNAASWGDLEVEMSARCEPLIQRVYYSSASTGRCFYCQYIVNLHEKVYSAVGVER